MPEEIVVIDGTQFLKVTESPDPVVKLLTKEELMTEMTQCEAHEAAIQIELATCLAKKAKLTTQLALFVN